MTSDPRVNAGVGEGLEVKIKFIVFLSFLKKHLSESIHTWIIDTM